MAHPFDEYDTFSQLTVTVMDSDICNERILSRSRQCTVKKLLAPMISDVEAVKNNNNVNSLQSNDVLQNGGQHIEKIK